MNKSILIPALLTSLFLGSSMVVHAETISSFSRDLSVGMSGPDIILLQKILNTDLITRISSSGPGSPGQETLFFGPKTTIAVKKFQEKYASEILLPAGLSRGTGYVGTRTRQMLEKVRPGAVYSQKPLVGSTISTSGTSTTETRTTLAPVSILPSTSPSSLLLRKDILSQAQAFAAILPDDVLIFGTSHTRVKAGDTLHITGVGFATDTTVHVGNFFSTKVYATSTGDISFVVPSLAHGSYDLWVDTKTGTSKIKSPTKIIISDTSDARPSLVSVSPESVGQGGVITIKADKLDAVGNTIYSSLGILRSVPSVDGHTLTFKVDDLANAPVFFRNTTADRYDVTFGIGNSSGLSLNYGHFIIYK